MPNRAARRAEPVPAVEPGALPPAGQQQVDVGRVIQRYRDMLAQAQETAIIAQAGQEQALEENGALRARIAELESNIENAALDADEANNQ